MKITPWIAGDNCSYRLLLGHTDMPENRVAFIERTPQVRIRPSWMGVDYFDGIASRQWPDFLNWVEGYKGEGPDDQASKDWCDAVLKATGTYEM